MQAMNQKLYVAKIKDIENASNNFTKTQLFQSIVVPRGRPFCYPGRLFWQAFSRSIKKWQPGGAWQKGFRHSGGTWVSFGAMLGRSWEPRGSPNRVFWHQVVSKSVEMMSGGGSQKKLELFIKICLENVSF